MCQENKPCNHAKKRSNTRTITAFSHTSLALMHYNIHCMAYRKINITLPSYLVDEAKVIATAHKTSVSSVFRSALERLIERYYDKSVEILNTEGLTVPDKLKKGRRKFTV